jgi:hypothetical protein
MLLHFAFGDLGCLAKVMAHCNPLDEAAAGMTEVGNIDKAMIAAELERAFAKGPATSGGERRPASPNAEDILSEGGSGSENSRTYYFWVVDHHRW